MKRTTLGFMFCAPSAPNHSTAMLTTTRIASRRSWLAAFKFATAEMNSGLALALVSSSKVSPELSQLPPPSRAPRPLIAAPKAMCLAVAGRVAEEALASEQETRTRPASLASGRNSAYWVPAWLASCRAALTAAPTSPGSSL
ncbi:hypothetical protein FQZ97_450060 [compost metagenome]